MTPEQINALPPHVRSFIHELAANADPAGTVRELAQLRDTNEALQKTHRRLRDQEAALFALLPGTYYMDEPDGGAPTLLEQLQRMAADAARYRYLRNDAEPDSSGTSPYCTVRDRRGNAWTFGTVLDSVVDEARKK